MRASTLPRRMRLLRDRLLAQSGFRDIECEDGSLRTDVRTDAQSRLVRDGAAISAYYDRAQAFLRRADLTELERAIWQEHAEGVSIAGIARKLGVSHRCAQDTVERLRARMLRPRVGRPPLPDGRGDGCVRLRVRLSDTEARALDTAVERLGLKRNQRVALIRRLIIELARRVIVPIDHGSRD